MPPENTAPALTVLMSCYNAERWLNEAIDSVLRQTFTDFEFIVIDDGSTDQTLKILKDYAVGDARFVIITKPNTGLSDSLNIGIIKARSEWIARLDQDDICEPTRLEKQIEFVRINPSLVSISTGCTLIDEHGARLAIHRYPAQHSALVRHLRTMRKFPAHSSAMYRTEVVRTVGGYRTKLPHAQDFDLWLRLAGQGNLACLNEPLVRIRQHADQMSHDNSGRPQKIDSHVAMTGYFISLYGYSDPIDSDNATFETFKKWIEDQLTLSGFFVFQDHKKHLKEAFQAAFSSPRRVGALLRAIVEKPDLSIVFLKEHLFGESLSRRFAREWIRQK